MNTVLSKWYSGGLLHLSQVTLRQRSGGTLRVFALYLLQITARFRLVPQLEIQDAKFIKRIRYLLMIGVQANHLNKILSRRLYLPCGQIQLTQPIKRIGRILPIRIFHNECPERLSRFVESLAAHQLYRLGIGLSLGRRLDVCFRLRK